MPRQYSNTIGNKPSYPVIINFKRTEELKITTVQIRHVLILWKTDAPGGNKAEICQTSLTPIFWPRQPQGHVMSVKCDEPIDELTVQVWLLYHHPNLKYCTLFVSGTELRTDRRTDRQTDKQTDGRTIRLLDAPKNAKIPEMGGFTR